MFPLDPAIIATLTPPCIGALIGYLTNKIAISMLFRPLRAWHIFGIRVPMTPGVIPRKRRALADNIGVMVGRHLLTSQDIGGALSAEPFQCHLHQLVERNINAMFKRDLGPLPEIVPKHLQSYFQIGVKTLKYRLATMVNDYIASPDFAEKLGNAMAGRRDDALDRQTATLLDARTRADLCSVLHGLGRELLTNEQNEERLARFLATTLHQAMEEGQTVGELLPEELVLSLRQLILDQSDTFLQKLGHNLADPKMRGQLVKGVLAGLDHFLDSMGPVGAVARGFLEPESLEGKIDAYLERRKEDFIVWLQQPEMRERILLIFEEYMDSLLQAPLSVPLARMGEEKLQHFHISCSRRILAILRTDKVMELLQQAIFRTVEDLSGQGKATLRDVLERILPEGGEARLRQSLEREILLWFRSPANERLVHGMVGSAVDNLLARPLGRLHDLVPNGVRTSGIDFVIMATNRILLQEVPGIVQSLNLERVVTEKVNGLDLLQLEHLLLSIMKEQFKYINIFGALLGFLIGFANVLLARLI